MPSRYNYIRCDSAPRRHFPLFIRVDREAPNSNIVFVVDSRGRGRWRPYILIHLFYRRRYAVTA